MHDALLQSPEGTRVRCGLCLHRCLIPEGGRGVCGVRGVEGGILRALSYGLVSSAAADPVEKKPVFHYHPGASVFSVGSVGCTMKCGHCQNWQISRPKVGEGDVPLRYLSPEELVGFAEQYGCEGVAFTYNEPVIWLEYVLDAARAAKAAGLFTIMVTNGYVTPEGLDLFAEVIDVWRVDIKGFAEANFKRLCHVPHAEAVREQAERARHVHGLHVECVTNVVPTINDSDEELTAMAGWIAEKLGVDTPWHVTRFVPYLEFAHLSPTPVATLERAREIGREAGLRHIYIGNVSVPGGENTMCWKCGALAIERHGFGLGATALTPQGACANCGADLNVKVGTDG